MIDGNNSHHAVSMAGKAMPRINKTKKMADMSAMGSSFHVWRVIGCTGLGWKKLQGKE
jgi:hypothetical protein